MRASFLSAKEWRAGCRAWNEGRPFEAHEHWEELWRRLEGTERQLLQSCIQLAAARVKASAGNTRGFASLVEKSLRTAPAKLVHACGLEPLLLAAHQGLERVSRGEPLEGLPWPALPCP